MPLNAARNRHTVPTDRKPFIARSRCLVGWWEFSARLFRPSWERCSTDGIDEREALEGDREAVTAPLHVRSKQVPHFEKEWAAHRSSRS